MSGGVKGNRKGAVRGAACRMEKEADGQASERGKGRFGEGRELVGGEEGARGGKGNWRIGSGEVPGDVSGQLLVWGEERSSIAGEML